MVYRLKFNNFAFIFQVIASLSYLFLYQLGIGYPIALFSVAIFVIRIIVGMGVLINSKKAHYVSITGSPIGFVYLSLSYIYGNSLLVIVPLFSEVVALILTIGSLSAIGRTKQPSPLDMPVYG